MFMPVQMFIPAFWLQVLSSGIFQVITWRKFRFAELWILPPWPSFIFSTVCYTINEPNLILMSLSFHNDLLVLFIPCPFATPRSTTLHIHILSCPYLEVMEGVDLGQGYCFSYLIKRKASLDLLFLHSWDTFS